MLGFLIFVICFSWVPVLFASMIVQYIKIKNHSNTHSSYSRKSYGHSYWEDDDDYYDRTLYDYNDSHLYDDSIDMLRADEEADQAYRDRDVTEPYTWAGNDFWV